MPTVRLGDINEDFYDAGAFSSTGVLPSARGY
jgi:hypothetical protein